MRQTPKHTLVGCILGVQYEGKGCISKVSKRFFGFTKPSKTSLNPKKLKKPETWISRYILQ